MQEAWATAAWASQRMAGAPPRGVVAARGRKPRHPVVGDRERFGGYGCCSQGIGVSPDGRGGGAENVLEVEGLDEVGCLELDGPAVDSADEVDALEDVDVGRVD